MRILQVLTTISFGDAVSNDTLALNAIIKNAGYKTKVYAENIDSRLPRGVAERITALNQIKSDDLVLYHLSTGTELNEWIQTVKCKKIMIYHNITPYHFFDAYCMESALLCKKGLEQTRALRECFDYVFADSEFNKKNLIEMGYTCPIGVLPILIPFEDYRKPPNKLVVKKYDDDYTNIIFTGRIAPNKKQEDVIETYYYYHKYYNPKSRLFLVGSHRGMETYYERLKEYAERLGAENVYFTGHIKFDEILAYYHVADAFLCMSEHEGFCVPLVEAMYFDIPIVAYDSCAIGGTMGGSGVLLKQKDKLAAAAVLHKIVNNPELRKKIISNQTERLRDFDNALVEEQFIKHLNTFLAK